MALAHYCLKVLADSFCPNPLPLFDVEFVDVEEEGVGFIVFGNSTAPKVDLVLVVD